jgi:hypothetical protein
MEAACSSRKSVDFHGTTQLLLIYSTRQNSLWSTILITLAFILIEGLSELSSSQQVFAMVLECRSRTLVGSEMNMKQRVPDKQADLLSGGWIQLKKI